MIDTSIKYRILNPIPNTQVAFFDTDTSQEQKRRGSDSTRYYWALHTNTLYTGDNPPPKKTKKVVPVHAQPPTNGVVCFGASTDRYP